ncbi:MAG: tRNA dihydrouridine(20/20a) synthase DusA [Burkholderiales bacterium]|nr:tRNA dihydrouridine(20/20a) synthase DusA [Burkholderiales bacterium]
MQSLSPHRFCVAPMMDLTDRHARFFLRLLSRRARLYTEMITTGALLHGDTPRFLRFDPAEHPLAIQLGGSDPVALAQCARMAEDSGYDEVNLNAGCPSDRVKSGRFGACLMAEPDLVADCMAAMIEAVDIPVTLKTRIGIDRDESTDRLYALVEAVRATGCSVFIIHARKAWLDGLSPKENREVPPLRYDVVAELKRAHPDLTIVLNGGLTTAEQCVELLTQVDGVMLGREAYYNPWLLAAVDPLLFGEAAPVASREEAVEHLLPYVHRELATGTPLSAMTRHVLGLYQAVPGARHWRRTLSEEVHRAGADARLLHRALEHVVSRQEAAAPVV